MATVPPSSHFRLPLVWLAAAFSGGILLADLFPFPWFGWLVLAVIVAVLGWWLSRRPRRAFRFTIPPALRPPLPLWIILCVFVLGGARYQLLSPRFDSRFVATYVDQGFPLTLQGVIVAPPDERDGSTRLRVKAEFLWPDETALPIPVRGEVLAVIWSPGKWAYGDRVRLFGDLQTPPAGETFSYRDYLERQGVYAHLPDAEISLLSPNAGNPFLAAVYRIRSRSLDLIYRLWPDPEASLLAGILMGVESGIPESVQEAFRATGTSHIIAISGFNMTIVAALTTALFGRMFGPRRGALAAAVGITFYTVLVGASAPVVRAAILGGLGIFAGLLGRRQHGINSLAIAALLMALVDPGVLWDVGFQLSFMATLGLVLYAAPLTQAFETFAARRLPAPALEKLAGPVSEYFLFTLAAQITTLPVILVHFQRLSLSSLFANPLILPAQPPVMSLGGLALFAAWVSEPLGRLAGTLVWPFVAYTVRVVEGFSDLFGPGFVVGELAAPLAFAFYLLLFGGTFVLRHWRDRLPAWLTRQGAFLRPAALLSLSAAAVIIWQAGFHAPDGRLHITLFPTGGGEAVLIDTPGGRRVLINGGFSSRRLSAALGRHTPYFRRQLDALLIANPAEDHITSLADITPRFPPGFVLWSGPSDANRESRYLLQQLHKLAVPVTTASTGHTLDLGDGVTLQVLAATRRGAVLLLRHDNFRLLLPSGVDLAALDLLKTDPAIRRVSAVLLADGGYAPANPPDWLAWLDPQLVLLSLADTPTSGRPDPAVLTALTGRTLLRTDQNGWIELSTDGEQLWVEVERK